VARRLEANPLDLDAISLLLRLDRRKEALDLSERILIEHPELAANVSERIRYLTNVPIIDDGKSAALAPRIKALRARLEEAPRGSLIRPVPPKAKAISSEALDKALNQILSERDRARVTSQERRQDGTNGALKRTVAARKRGRFVGVLARVTVRLGQELTHVPR
jgi:hypothetical protein